MKFQTQQEIYNKIFSPGRKFSRLLNIDVCKIFINKFFSFLLGFSVSVYYFPTEEEDDEDGPTMKEKLLAAAIKGIDTFCVWDCCWCWREFKKGISWIVFDPFTELFITLCIVVNTLFMALDHHNMNREVEKVLKAGNYVRFFFFLSIPITSSNVPFFRSFSLLHSPLKQQ